MPFAYGNKGKACYKVKGIFIFFLTKTSFIKSFNWRFFVTQAIKLCKKLKVPSLRSRNSMAKTTSRSGK